MLMLYYIYDDLLMFSKLGSDRRLNMLRNGRDMVGRLGWMGLSRILSYICIGWWLGWFICRVGYRSWYNWMQWYMTNKNTNNSDI